ncbi:MAG: prepilin peptidase [Corynebacteriales bacterium]|nr:prepilin peptidase [Mycobacteriales bacterium]
MIPIACAVVLGLFVGSGLSTIALRLPYRAELRAPAHCPVCERQLRLNDRIPLVSWLLLVGKCRYCGTFLGWRYPAMELATGALFGLCVWRVGLSPILPALLYMAAIAVVLTAIDLDVHRLPDALTLPSYAVLLMLLTGASIATGDLSALLRAGISALVLFAGYYAIAMFGGMGFGDVKLAGVLGLLLGWHSWSMLIVGTVLGFALGGVISVVLLLFGWAKRDTHIAFGPFMLAGALGALLLAQDVTVADLTGWAWA